MVAGVIPDRKRRRISSMHRRSLAVVVIFAGLAMPICSQHAGGTGQSGGVEGYGGPAYSSYAAVGRSGVLSTAQYGGMNVSQLGATSYARTGSGQSAFTRPSSVGDPGRLFNNRNDRDRFDHDRDDRDHAPYLPLYGVVTLHSIGYLGSFNPGYYVDLANPAPQLLSAPLAIEYDAPPRQLPPHRGNLSEAIPAAEHNDTPERPAAVAPASSFRSTYQRRQPLPDFGAEGAVTLVFKDGRPTEEIHNYMLTRKTLYVQGQRLREIPVDQLDLAATEKVNQEAGVDFRLPGTSR